jgi:hypothetical protein
MANRAAITQAVRSQPRVARGSGGTSAPNSAGRGGATGLWGTRRPAEGQWSPKGETKNTDYAKGLGTTPAGSAGAAPSPYTPAPWDSQYDLSVAGAHDKYANTISNLGVKKTAADQDFGLGDGYNDYKANPYSRAALLEQSYMKANRGTGNSYAAAGQLYAGSLSTAYDANRGARDQEHDSLEKQYRDALQGIRDEELNAKNEEIDAIDEAGWNRIQKAGEAPLDPDTAPESGGGSGGDSTKNSSAKNKPTPKKKQVIHEAVSNNRALPSGKKKK